LTLGKRIPNQHSIIANAWKDEQILRFTDPIPTIRTGLYWEKGDRISACSITGLIATTRPSQPQKKNPVMPHPMIQVEKSRASQFGIQHWGQPYRFDGLVGGG
jgi:hypothetical protein